MKHNIIIEIICFLLIALFVYAAFSKLFTYTDFKNQLSRSPFIKEWPGTIAIVLPLAELLIATMLIVNVTRRAGLIISFIMLTLFTVYIIYMLVFEKNLPCSCGGVLKQLTWKQHLLFNLFFAGIAFAGIRLEKNISHKQIAY